jgi:outer membrane biosynthesis protein TonB
MERSERTGLGLSVAGHVGLLVILSLNLMSVRKLPKLSEPMDVMLVDKAGLTSAAPVVAKEAPQASEAPEVAKTVEEAPPPEPAPAPPKPVPTPPKPSPSPKAVVKPAPPTPPASAKPKATSLGTDFLRGIPVEKSTGKAAAPRAAAISPIAMNGLAALIASQVKPCYTIPAGGTDTTSIISRVRLRLKKDGSIAVAPEIIGNLGVNSANQPYLRQMNEAATRALQRCAPYKLPAELYEGGWDDLIFRFNPGQM